VNNIQSRATIVALVPWRNFFFICSQGLTKLEIPDLVFIDQSERIFPDGRRIGEIRRIGEGFERKKALLEN
jgi:hypothetical protein